MGSVIHVGGKAMYFDLSTKCINGYKGTVKILTLGIGASAGKSLGTEVSLGGRESCSE